jgi:exodeoxyribonuclease VII small subunit
MNEKNISFEEAMERLDGAVRALESGNLGLDAAMQTYEDAIKLLRICHGALENAERRVNVLVEGAGGELTQAPFESNEA